MTSSQREVSSTAAAGEMNPPQEGEHIVLRGLQAKPELNGRVGVVRGALNADSRFPVHLEGKSSCIAVKPANMYQLGVFVLFKAGKSRKYTCSTHRRELCDACSLDMRVVNHLFKLHHYKQSLTTQNIEEIAELNFASHKMKESGETRRFDRDCPVHCAGLSCSDKRFILKSLLAYDKSQTSSGKTVPLTILVAMKRSY